MAYVHKTRVAVLRGGPSSEYEVSLKSGESVLKHLSHDKYHPIDVLISKDGAWHLHGVERNPHDVLKHVDVAFLALHGQFGEDGKVQRLLEHMHVPFTGSKALPSAIAMNKHLAKRTLGLADSLKGKIKLAWHKLFTREDIDEKGIHMLFREIPHPSVVKPASAGSSVGVTIVRSFHDLETALAKAFEHGDQVIIEEFIGGREATCGVVDGYRGEECYTLLPVEIIPDKDSPFFDYEAKYCGKSCEVCPSNFDDATKRAIQEAARAAHRELGLRHYSRSDFIVHPKRGVYFLETNTLPGLADGSLLPKSVQAVGSSMPEFLDHVISLAKRSH